MPKQKINGWAQMSKKELFEKTKVWKFHKAKKNEHAEEIYSFLSNMLDKKSEFKSHYIVTITIIERDNPK